MMVIFDISKHESAVLMGFPIALVIFSIIGVIWGRSRFPKRNEVNNFKVLIRAVMTVIVGMILYIMGALVFLNSGKL